MVIPDDSLTPARREHTCALTGAVSNLDEVIHDLEESAPNLDELIHELRQNAPDLDELIADLQRSAADRSLAGRATLARLTADSICLCGCGRVLIRRRRHKRYFSNACRQRAYRQREAHSAVRRSP